MISNLCRCLHKYPVHRAIYSSAEVYGDAVHTGLLKSTGAAKSYYGIAKFASERLLRKQSLWKRASLLILRPPVYGSGEKGSLYGPMYLCVPQ